MLKGWKMFLFGLAVAIVPGALDYLGTVPWQSLGVSPAVGAMIGIGIIALRKYTDSPMFSRKAADPSGEAARVPMILLPLLLASGLALSACGGAAVTVSRAVLPAADLARIEQLCSVAGPALGDATKPDAPQNVRDVAVYPAAYCRELASGTVPGTTDGGTVQWLPAVLAATETAARVAGVVLPLLL